MMVEPSYGDRSREPPSDPNTAREGHGLGLNIVKRVAQLLNHELRVESQPGKGSVFSVIVPRSVEDSEAHTKEIAVRPATAPGQKIHILVVMTICRCWRPRGCY